MTKFRWVVQPQFQEAQLFVNNLAAAKINNKWGYLNKEGQWVIQPQFEDARPL